MTVKSQAARVFDKFGGVPNLHRALVALEESKPKAEQRKRWVISGIYKWDMPKGKQGTGGLIPAQSLRDVMRAAAREGIVLTSQDLYPTETR